MSDAVEEFTTHTAERFRVRPIRHSDQPALREFFKQVTPEDLRFRFLGGVKEVGHERLAAMTDVDHQQTESFVVYERDGMPFVAAGMLACDPELKTGEVAISVRADYKNRGISWELLRFIMRYAEAKGVRRLQSLESRANHSAIRLEKELGFTSKPASGDSTLVVLEKTLDPSS